MTKKKRQQKISRGERVRRRLKHFRSEPKQQLWLDTGLPLLNAVLGSEEYGIPYGKIIEVHGPYSNGKTALMLDLAGMAQEDGAAVAIADLENSFDVKWARRRGLDPKADSFDLFKYYVGRFGNTMRMTTVEDIVEELEAWMEDASKEFDRLFVGVDSIASMLTKEQEGTSDPNMRTKQSLPQYLSSLGSKWAAKALTCNAMIMFTNQIRKRPGMSFGDPTYTPGGNAMQHYATVRASMTRSKKRIVKRKRGDAVEIGIRGSIRNIKNKTGEESVEGMTAGYKIFFNGDLQMMTEKEYKAEKRREREA